MERLRKKCRRSGIILLTLCLLGISTTAFAAQQPTGGEITGVTPGEITGATPGEVTQTQYTITYNTDGGSTVNGETVTADDAGNASVTLPAAPSKDGYAFVGWSDGTTTYGVGNQVAVTGNATFTALWAKLHIVSYQAGAEEGVSGMPTAQLTDSNGSVTLAAAPSRSGYRFNGWLASDGQTSYTAGQQITLTADVQLTAQWIQIYKVTFEAGEAGTAVAAPGAIEVDAGSSVTLPAALSWEKHDFLGWQAQGADTPSDAGTSYTPQGDVTFTAQWFTWPKVISYSDLQTIIASSNKHWGSWGELIAALPKTLTYTLDKADRNDAGAQTTGTINITGWQLILNGEVVQNPEQTYKGAIGNYQLRPVYQLPERIQEMDSLPIILVSIEKEQTSATITDSTAQALYTFTGSAGDDVITITYEDGYLVITYQDGSDIVDEAKVTTRYRLSGKTKIVIDGAGGNDVINLNASSLPSGMNALEVTGGHGVDTITTQAGSGSILDWTAADVKLQAENILFQQAGLTIRAKSLNICPAIMTGSGGNSDPSSGRKIVVNFTGVTVQTTGAFTVSAQVVDQEVVTTPEQSETSFTQGSANESVKIPEKTETAIREAIVEIVIDKATINAASISITGQSKLKTDVTSTSNAVLQGMKASTTIKISNQAVLNSLGSLYVKAEAIIIVNSSGSVISVVSANSDAIAAMNQASLKGGSIEILANNQVNITNTSVSGDSGGTSPPTSVTVTGVTQTTTVSAENSTLKGADGSNSKPNITIQSSQTTDITTTAKTTVSSNKSSAQAKSMDALLNFLSGLGYSDGSKVFDSTMCQSLRTKYENALIAAAKDSILSKDDKSEQVTAQQVGAFAANLVNITNAAFIKGGEVEANTLSLLASGNNNIAITADASGVKAEVTDATSGIGAAAALNHITYQNQAYLEGTATKADDTIKIEAVQNSSQKNTALAGLSKGENFGIAGAIALNFYKGTIEAWLKGITQWSSSLKNVTIKVTDVSNQETLADAVPNNTNKDVKVSGKLLTGTGAAIAYNVFDNRVQAYMTGCSSASLGGNLNVSASSEGKNKAYAYCGSGRLLSDKESDKAGKSLVSSLGMNILYQEVKAFIDGCGTITLNGTLDIAASAKRAVDILADSQKADADIGLAAVTDGNPTAVESVSLALNTGKILVESNLNTSIAKAAGVNVKASSDYSENVHSISGLLGQSILNSAGSVFGIYNLVDNLFLSAQKVSGLNGTQGVPDKSPLRAKTYEFIVDTAAAEALSNTTLATKASIGKASGGKITLAKCNNVNVAAVQKGTFVVFGDASTASKSMIGTAAALGNYSVTNEAGIENNVNLETTGTVKVSATNGDGSLSFKVMGMSGTSTGNTTGAGVVVLEKLAMAYRAYVNGIITAASAIIESAVTEKSELTAGSDSDVLSMLLKTEGTGLGAAFTWLDMDGSVKAEVGEGAQITTTGTGDSLKIAAQFDGTHTITAQSGGKTSLLDQKWTAEKNAMDASLALNTITLNVEALVGSGATVTSKKGNIIVSANTKIQNTLSAKATQNGSSKAAGASAAINLVKVGTHARVSGTAGAPTGKFSVKAEAASADDASAYASSSGVDVKEFNKGNKKKWLAAIIKGEFGTLGFDENGEGELNEEYRICEDTGIAGRINNAFGIGVSAFQPISNALLIRQTINSYKQNANGKVEKDSDSKMVFAAAFGMNKLNYDTSADIDGTVTEANSVEVLAVNNNNFRTYGTALATSADKAIAAAAALLMNSSKTQASAKNLGSAKNHIGSITIKAVTTNNMGEGGFEKYKDAIAAQALSGAKTAQSGEDTEGKATSGISSSDLAGSGVSDDDIKKSTTLGFAGGVAIIITGIQTIANLSDNASVFTDGALLIQASEEAKLGARGWGGDYSKKSSSNEPSGIGAGLGLALIIADNKVHAYIGNGSNVTAGSVKILAERLRVDQSAYDFSWDLEFNLSFTDKDGNLKPEYSTNINVENLIKQFTDAINYFASCNFYAGAIGGAIASGASASGAGSFAILILNNTVTSNVGKNVKLVLLNNGSLDVEAKSDIFAMTVSGTITTSGKVGIGASAGVNNTTDVVKAYMDNNVTVTNPGNVSVTAATKYLYIGVAAAGVKADKAGISGILILLNGGNTTSASLGDNFTLTGGKGDVLVSASNDFTFYGIPVGAAFSKNGSNVGATVLVLNMNEVITASMGDNLNVDTTKNVSVKADSEEFLFSVVAGGGYAGKAEVVVNPATKVLDSQITASIGTGTINAKDVLVHAKGIVKTFAVSADVAASKKIAIGGVSDTNVFNQIIKAYLNGTTLNLTGNLTVEASSVEDIRSYVVGVAAGGDMAAQGSVSVQKLNNTVSAYLGNGTKVNKAVNVTVHAADSVTMWILAGGIEASKTTAAGIANADVLLNSTVNANIGSGVTVITSGDVKILADSTENIKLFVVGGSASGKVAANGSVAVILITDNVLASIGNGSTVTADGNVQIKADKSQTIASLVGVINGAGTAAIGASSNTIKVNGTTKASIEDNAKVTAKGLTSGISIKDGVNNNATSHQGILLGAYVSTILKNLVVGGSGAGTAAIGASSNVVLFESTTETNIGKATLSSEKDIIAAAADSVVMHNIVGSVQLAGTAAIGAAFDTVTLTRKVKSQVADGANISAEGNIFVTALAAQEIHVIVAGLAASGTASVNGNGSVILSKNEITAQIGTDDGTEGSHAQAFANGNIAVLASLDSDMQVIAGSASASGTVAVAAGVSVITASDTTKAQTGAYADVTALGNATAVSFYNGSKKSKKNHQGLMIGAYNNAVIKQIVFAAGGSGAVAVSPASATVISNAQTIAKIGAHGKINKTSRENHTASSNQGVRIVAASDSDCDSKDGGAAAAGTVGVGAAVVVIKTDKHTEAAIGAGAKVAAKAGVEILSSSYNKLTIYAAALGGGVVGVSGSVNVVLINDTTLASVESGTANDKTTINAGSINISAASEQTVSLNAGTVSAGIVGVGAAAIVLTFQQKTQALVGDAANAYVELISTGAVDIQAVSNETVTANVLGGQGGVVAVGGSAVVLIMNVTTQANVANNASIDAGGNLNIKAQDTSVITGRSGTAGGGVAAVGGAVVVILYRNTISAGIQGGNIKAGAISILSKADRTVDAMAFAAGGGVASVNGSVVVISIGATTGDSNTSTALKDTITNAQMDTNSALGENGSFDLSKFFTGSTLTDKVSAFIAGGTITAVNGGISIQSVDTTTVSALAGQASGGVTAIGGAVVIVTLSGTSQASAAGTISSTGTLDVLSTETLNVKQLLTVSGSGGLVGLGGSVVILSMTGKTEASLAGTIVKAGAVNVKAINTLTANNVQTIAGAVGAVGLGAAYSQVNMAGSVNAYLTNLTVTEAGAISVLAKLNITGKIFDGNVAVGIAVGAGAAVVQVKITSTVQAYANALKVTKADSLSVNAEENLSLDVQSYGLAGGIWGAATGTTATVEITGNVAAWIKGSSNVNITKDITVQSLLQVKKLDVTAAGAGGALGAAGSLTYLKVTLSPTVKAYIENSTVNAGGDVSVLAYYNKDAVTFNFNGAAGAAAGAVAGSGILMEITTKGSISAYMLGSTATAGKDVNVIASGYTKMDVLCGAGAMALGFSVGGARAVIKDELSVKSYLDGSKVKANADGYIYAVYAGDIKSNVIGAAGGILAAGTAQSHEITSKVSVGAYIKGGSFTTGDQMTLSAQRQITITAVVKGYAASGFVSGGLTSGKIYLQDSGNGVYVQVTGNAVIDAGGNAIIGANNKVSITNEAYASTAAIGGTANDVNAENEINLKTAAIIDAACSIKAGSIRVDVVSDKYYKAYASSFAGAIIALGVATALQNVTDDVYVYVYRGSSLEAVKGDLIIVTTSAYTGTPTCEAKGGKGGLATGVNVKAEMNQTVNSHIETFTAGSGKTTFKSTAGTVQFLAQSYLIGTVKSSIAFGVDGISFLNTDSNTTNTVKSYIDFGEYTEITGVDVTLYATVVRVNVEATTNAETVSALNTQLRPRATMNNTINSYVTLRNHDKVTASGVLTICAAVESVTAKTYSKGDTKGVTGSVISTSTNNTTVDSKVNVYGAETELKGTSVLITATSANTYRNNTVNYSNEATYKAYTATEFIKQTVERVTTVVETWTEKICEKLPWWLKWLGTIIKFVVHTVVKVIRWFEEILVEKILQSETDAIQNGSFNSSESIHLEGHIYYGANAPVNIIVDQNGNINNQDVDWVKSGDTIYIKSFKSASSGKFIVSAVYGTVNGNVTVHSNDLITSLTITNNSAYHLKVGTLLLTSNQDPDACNYQIIAMTNDLKMTDTTDIDVVPEITIQNAVAGKNIIFAGQVKDYSAIIRIILNGGSVYMEQGEDVELAGNQIYITGANEIGTEANPFRFHLYMGGTGNAVSPILQMTATGNIYVAITLMQYVDNRLEDQTEDINSITAENAITITAGKKAVVALNGAVLKVAQTVTADHKNEYTYEKTEVTQEKVDVSLYQKYSRTKLDGLTVSTDADGNLVYTLDGKVYVIPDGYWLSLEENPDGTFSYWQVSNLPTESYYVYTNTGEKVELADNQQIFYSDGTGTEEKGYYLITTKTVTVTETLTTTLTDGVEMVDTPIAGYYHLAVISGQSILLMINGDKAHTELWADQTITGTDGVDIQGKNDSDIYINNVVSSANGNVTVSAERNHAVVITANGRLQALNAEVNVTAGTISTQKTSSATTSDITAKKILLSAANDIGSKTTPIHVVTGTDGITASGNNIYLTTSGSMVLNHITATNLVYISSTGNVVLVSGHTGTAITADKLELNSKASVGTSSVPVTVNIGAGGWYVTAAGNIYMNQNGQAGYLNEVTSSNGTITIIADGQGNAGNLYLGKITANTQITIQSLHGSLIQNSADASVTAPQITLKAGASIGTSDKYVIIALGTGKLKAEAGDNVYLQDLEGTVKIDTITAGNVAAITTAGAITNGTANVTNVTGATVLLKSDGQIGEKAALLKVKITNGLTVWSGSNIYLYLVGAASHVNATAAGNILLNAEGTVLIDSVLAGQGTADVEIISQNGDILGCETHGTAAVISAGNVKLTAENGAIKSQDSSNPQLLLALAENGSLTAAAKNDILVRDTDGAVQAKSLTSTEGNISLSTKDNVILGVLRAAKQITVVSAQGSILNGNTDNQANLTAKNLLLQAKNTIGTAEKSVRTNVDAMTVKAEGNIYLTDTEGTVIITEMTSTNGNLNVETAGDIEVIKAEAKSGNITLDINGTATLGTLEAGSKAGNIISITAAKDIVNRNLTDVWNLLANAIVLNAQGAIGSSSSSLRTDADSITATAQGNIWLTDIYGAVTVHGLTSKTGGITLITNGDTRITSMQADRDIQVTAQSGNISLASVVTRQKAIVTAAAGSITRITDVENTNGNIIAQDITLDAADTIGTAADYLTTNLGTGILEVKAHGNVFLKELDGNAAITAAIENGSLYIKSKNTITLTSQSYTLHLGEIIIDDGNVNLVLGIDIVNGLEAGTTDVRNITAADLTVTANGYSIGTAEKAVTMDLATAGKLTVRQAKSVYLSEKDTLHAVYVQGSAVVSLVAESGDALTGEIYAEDIIIQAAGKIAGEGNHTAYVTGKNIRLTAGTGIGSEDAYYLMNTDGTGAVSAKAAKNIYLQEVSGNLNAAEITTPADVYLKADGSILSGSDSFTNVSGTNLYLTADHGTIGTTTKELTINQLDGGSLTAATNNQIIYLYADSNLNLIRVNAGTAKASLRAKGNITNGRSDKEEVIAAGNLYLETTEGNMGTESKALLLNLANLGRLDITAKGSVYLEEKDAAIKLGVLKAEGEHFVLRVPGDILTALTLDEVNAGIANITANNIQLISVNGQIGADTNKGQSYLEEDYEGWITTTCNKEATLNASAKADIFIRELTGSMKVGSMISETGNVNASALVDLFGDLIKGKDIYVETTKGEISISVEATGDVIINSCGNISNLKPGTIEGADSILIQGNNITLISREGSIGAADSYIEIDLAPNGVLNAAAHGDIYIREINGNLNIGQITSQTGNVGLDVKNGSLLATRTDGAYDIYGKNILLTALEGTVGTKERPLLLESDGTVTVQAKGDIVLTEMTGDLALDTVVTEADVVLSADGSILVSSSHSAEHPVITGENLSLTAVKGSIGTKAVPMTVKLLNNGVMNANAKGSVYLDAPETNMNLGAVIATDEIIITAKGSIENADASVYGYNLKANSVELTSKEGTIGTQDKAVITYGGLLWAIADKNIYLESVEDLNVRTIESVTGDIELTGKKNIFNALVPAQNEEVKANLTAKNITIHSGASVGTAQQYFVTDLKETNGVTTGFLNADAVIDLFLREAAGDLISQTLKAGQDIYLGPTTGNVVLQSVVTGRDFTLENTGKNVTIVKAEVARDMTIAETAGNVTVDKTVVTKDMTIASTGGNVLVKDETTNGNFTVKETTGNVTVETGVTAGNFTITKTGLDVTVNKADVAGNMAITFTEADVTVDEAKVKGNMNVSNTIGSVTVTKAEVTGNMTIAETAGNVTISQAKAQQDITIDKAAKVTIQKAEASKNLTISNVAGLVKADELTAGIDATIKNTGSDVLIDRLTTGKNLLMENVKGNVTIPDATIRGNATLKVIGGDTDIKSKANLNIIQIDSAGNVKIETTQSVNAEGIGTINGSTLTIKAGGSIGSAGSKLNTIISGKVTMEAGSDIYYNERNTIYVDKIKAGGTLDLTAGQAILMSAAGSYGVEAGNIRMTAANIGNAGAFLMMNITGSGSVNAKVSGSAYLAGRNDFRAGQIQTGSLSYIKASGSIVNAAAGTNVQAGTITLEAGGAIGSGNALQVQSSSISAKAGSLINLASAAAMQITAMQAPVAITLKAAQIMGSNIVTSLLDMTASGNIGSTGSLLQTTVTNLRASAGGFAGIQNSGNLNIQKLDAANAVVKGGRLTTSAAVNADSLELNAAGGIGNGINDAFLANVASITANTSTGSIFFKNAKSLKVNTLRAAAMVYLAAAGNVTGGSNAVTSDTFVFDTQGLDIQTNVNAVEGTSTKNVKLTNAKALTIGNASDSYQGIHAQGTIDVKASSALTVNENLKTSGEANINAAGNLTVADGASVSADSGIVLKAGSKLRLSSGAKLKTSNTASLTGSEVEVLGTVNAGNTSISGGSRIDSVIQSGMGNIKIMGTRRSCSYRLRLMSLSGNINIQGSGNLDMTTTSQSEKITVTGSGFTIDGHEIQAAGLSSIILNNPGGNNRYDFYDTPCTFTVNSGNGNDTYYVGKLNSGYTGIKTTEGVLSPGNSHALTINEQGGSNQYVIYSAKAPLTVNGGSGSDSFIVKAFVQILSDGTLVKYQNAEMNLDGAGGSNSLEVIKSALFDKLSDEDGNISGSGLNIKYNNVEQVEISKYRAADEADYAWTTWMWIVYSLKQMAESGILYIILLFIAILAGAITGLVIIRRRKKKIAA